MLTMRHLSKHTKTSIILITALVLIFGSIGIYKYQKIRVFDKILYTKLYTNLEHEGENFKSQKDLRNYITNWADTNSLKYKVDDNGNIIFRQKASSRKKHVTPTVIVVSYNYENAVANRKVLSSAAIIAYTKLESGQKTVIFVNNKNNDGSSYLNIDPAYIPDKSKVIYLDYGKAPYVSSRSFRQEDSVVKVIANREPLTCDTAIRITIGGIRSDVIDTNVSKHVNPISLFSTVLTRLKSKSTICQLADIKVNNRGYMFPTELSATILVNSYAVDSLTNYLNKRIKTFDKSVKEKNPDAYYNYKVLEEESKYFPEDAYDRNTFNSLTTILYALKNGVYRYNDEDVIPEGYDENAIYGINCVRQLVAEDDAIYIDITSQAADRSAMKKVKKDNSAASALAGCTITTVDKLPQFNNKKSGLINTLKSTYFKVNDLAGDNVTLHELYDTYFTPMTYLYSVNPSADIVHIKESSDSASVLTNMLLCYIETKGNFLSL